MKVAAGHVEDEGGIRRKSSFPGDGVDLIRGVVRGGKDELGGGVAVGERCLKRGGDGEGGGDAGDDLEGDSRSAEGCHLFIGAAEDEGVSGLEAQHGALVAGVLDHECVDASLGDAWLAAALADRDNEGGWTGEVQHFIRNEVVGQDDVCGLDEVEGTPGEEVGVAWAGAAEIDFAGLDGEAHNLGLVSAWARA